MENDVLYKYVIPKNVIDEMLSCLACHKTTIALVLLTVKNSEDVNSINRVIDCLSLLELGLKGYDEMFFQPSTRKPLFSDFEFSRN